MKQVKHLYLGGFNAEERSMYRQAIERNVIQNMQGLLEGSFERISLLTSFSSRCEMEYSRRTHERGRLHSLVERGRREHLHHRREGER